MSSDDCQNQVDVESIQNCDWVSTKSQSDIASLAIAAACSSAYAFNAVDIWRTLACEVVVDTLTTIAPSQQNLCREAVGSSWPLFLYGFLAADGSLARLLCGTYKKADGTVGFLLGCNGIISTRQMSDRLIYSLGNLCFARLHLALR